MNSNQTVKTACCTLALILASSSGALASSDTTSRIFVSGPLVLLFLGFCALVVVIQCVPAILMLIGMIKGASSKKSTAAMQGRQS